MNWTQEQLEERNREVLGNIAPRADAQLAAAKPKPRMNKWEAEYEAGLRAKWAAGMIRWYAFEPFKLRLADDAWYKPDFAILANGRLSFIEVKGFLREAAMVRFKVAASLYREFEFTMVRRKLVKEGGGWEVMRTFNGATLDASHQGVQPPGRL